jgi:hypothetical protein
MSDLYRNLAVAKFKPGQSGNPGGRQKGSRDRRSAFRELIADSAEDLIKKVVEMAKAGDMTALRICVDRILPPVKEVPLRCKLPPITKPQDCTEAQAAVLAAVAVGEMLPSEGQALSGLIEHQRRAYETTEIASRLAAIEEKLNGGKP